MIAMNSQDRPATTGPSLPSGGTMLVVGATGIVGNGALEHFRAQPGWEVIALSRRVPAAHADLRHLPVDLTDAQACRDALAGVHHVTHVLFAALHEKADLLAGWQQADQIDTNVTMLRNLLDALEASPSAATLRHVTLLQGTKAYGSHVGRVPVPAKERWPRLPHTIFYWQQEDLLRERHARGGWAFTILRPQIILGYASGSPMNIIAAIGAYAAIQRACGLPLSFPGGGRYVNAASDSRLIARAVQWAGTHPVAFGETYNVVNGDVLVWQDVWSAIAARFGMPVGEPRPMRLADEMPAHEATWGELVRRHGLRSTTLSAMVGSSWQFADRNLAAGQPDPVDRVVSPVKLRQAGFTGCQDTEASLLYWLERMQQARLLPA
jgi:nucleoside-diphosphate-sugar epimerase